MVKLCHRVAVTRLAEIEPGRRVPGRELGHALSSRGALCRRRPLSASPWAWTRPVGPAKARAPECEAHLSVKAALGAGGAARGPRGLQRAAKRGLRELLSSLLRGARARPPLPSARLLPDGSPRRRSVKGSLPVFANVKGQ